MRIGHGEGDGGSHYCWKCGYISMAVIVLLFVGVVVVLSACPQTLHNAPEAGEVP